MINKCIGCYHYDSKENVCTHGSPIFLDDTCTDYQDNEFVKQTRADEREKVLEGFEKYYINAEPEECATCDDVEPYGCFKCLLKKYKEQE